MRLPYHVMVWYFFLPEAQTLIEVLCLILVCIRIFLPIQSSNAQMLLYLLPIMRDACSKHSHTCIMRMHHARFTYFTLRHKT
jgi:hypothetical protein